MDFDNNRPIYLQIVDSICDNILTGVLNQDERILSVREYGAEIGVNPNTVARSYEKLTDMGVIFQKRGIGFFVAPDAKARIHESAVRTFLEQDLPAFKKKAEMLGIDVKQYL